MATSLDKYRDIFDKKAFCHLATVGRDGKPQVTPVWCDFDGTHVRINTARGRVKDKNLKANPVGGTAVDLTWIRGDLRHIRTLQDITLFGVLDNQPLDFWRASAGITLRF